GQNGAERLPLWFIEGMAEYLSLGPIDPNTAMWLRDAARPQQPDSKANKGKDTLPSIDDLNNPKYFPYRWGQAFWAYVAGTYGDDEIGRLFRIAALAGDADAAIKRVLGVTAKQLSADWQAATRQTYEPMLAASKPIGEAGKM